MVAGQEYLRILHLSRLYGLDLTSFGKRTRPPAEGHVRTTCKQDVSTKVQALEHVDAQ